MSEENKRSGCLKNGCFGCGALAFLFILGFASLSFLQFVYERGDHPVSSQQMEQELPAPADLGRLIAAGEIAGSLDVDGDRPTTSVNLWEEIGDGVGTIVLDLDVGEFELLPGEPGEPVRVEAEHEGVFVFDESLDEDENGNWRYRISLRPKGGMMGLMLRGAGNNPTNRVVVRLPPDRAFDLVGELGLGTSQVELGGLLVRNVVLELGTGEHEIRFSKPLPVPMQSLVLDKSVGELRVRDVGNASPARVDIAQSVGEATVGLAGSWRNDSSIKVRNGIGEARVGVPGDVRVEVDRARVSVGDRSVRIPESSDRPADGPTLFLDVSGTIGEVGIVDN